MKYLATLALFFIPMTTFAYTVDTPYVHVDTSGSGTVTVPGTGTVQGSGAVDVQGANGSVKTNGSTSVQVTGVSSVPTNVTVVSRSISAQVKDGLTSEQEKALVNLEGNASAYVKSDTDVKEYGKLVVKNTPVLVSANTTATNVEVIYKQKGRLLWLIPVTMSARTVVDADGNVSLALPWWGFLVSNTSADVKAAVQEKVATEIKNREVKAEAGSLSVESQAKLIHAVSGGISVTVTQ